MPANELDQAKEAILQALVRKDQSLAELIAELVEAGDLREDAVRVAFWHLVGEGAIELDKNFVATRSAVAA